MGARKRFFLVILLLASLGCDPTLWDALRAEAPVVVISSPGGVGAAAFGSVLTAYEANLGGDRASRVVVAGATNETDSGFYSYPVYEGLDRDEARLRLGGGAVLTACEFGQCDPGHGVSMAAFPEWTVGGAIFHGCVAVPSRSSGKTQVWCEDQQPTFQTVLGPLGEDFGASSAGIVTPRHPVGVALFGAPAADLGDGAVYRLPSGASVPIRIDLSAMNAPPGGRMGSSLAAKPLSENAILFAVRAIDADGDRVIVASIEVDSMSDVHVTNHACIEGPSGFGAALAFGDLDADGSPDLAVGMSIDSSEQSMYLFRGADLIGSHAGCGDAIQPTPASTITCADVSDEEISCDDGPIGLGTALAIGDVDGDGVADLIAGAPNASPSGNLMAGAVFALAGESGALERVGARRSVLLHSGQGAGDRLGHAVATIPGRGHDEIAAGAPGAREVAVFLCSGLGDDRPSPHAERGCVDR